MNACTAPVAGAATATTLFQEEAWQSLLTRAFGTRSVMASAGDGTAIVLPVFRRGPLSIGYPGFPGGLRALSRERASQWCEALAGRGVHGLRIVKPDSHEGWPSSSLRMARSVIETLQDWEPSALRSSIRRNLRKAERQGVAVKVLTGSASAPQMHALYRETLSRHGGRTRYTEGYFQALLDLSRTDPRVRCTGVSCDGRLAAFVCVAESAGDAFYLHGAQDPRFQAVRAMDLLFRDAIEHARGRGCARFDFLASPPAQSSLIRFKEKWGAVTRDEFTHDLPVPGPGGRLFHLAAVLSVLARKVGRRKAAG